MFCQLSFVTGNIQKGIEKNAKNTGKPHLGYGVREGATGHISSVFAMFVLFSFMAGNVEKDAGKNPKKQQHATFGIWCM